MFPPLFLSDDSPPFIFPWKPDLSNRGILRNKRGNSFLERVTEPLKEEVNERRRKWGLPELAMLNDFFSEKGIITQLPQFLDFQRSAPPPSLAYTAPFYDGAGRPKINFPWSRLNGKPIAYASMGTARCGSQEVFELIASALSGSNFQLVMTLGGMNLTPSNISNVPDDAIVVHFAPQTELIKKASLCITHGGMNTVLDAVSNGVPLIIIPVTDDQPGVGARIEWVKAGLAIPFRQLTLQRLRDSITMVASTSHYREVVKEMERKLAHRDGVGEAARIVRERLA
jgi:zeaxanthin glucosyltransferase